MTDFILDGNIADLLRMSKNIIQNGFDPQQLMSGMSEHFRNLYTCLISGSPEFLEAGKALQAKYLQQASRCNLEFLNKALVISNDFDVKYNLSSHKNLFVEITFIQICNLIGGIQQKDIQNKAVLQKPIEPANKKKPIQELRKIEEVEKNKPKTEENETKYETKNKQTEKPKVTEKTEKPSDLDKQKEIHREVEEVKKKPEKNHTVAEQKPREDAAVEPEKHRLKPKQPAVSSGFSIKAEMSNKLFEKEEITELIINQREEYDLAKLCETWQSLAKSYQKTNQPLARSLQVLKPEELKDGMAIVNVQNDIQKQEILNHKIDILNFVRKELQNGLFNFEVKRKNSTKTSKPVLPSEKYDAMAKKEPSLKKLRDSLQLDLDL